jgi:hypothetical protein
MNTPEIKLDGHDTSKLPILINGKKIIVGIGCSWTRAWGYIDDDLHSNDPNRKDDTDFLYHRSYVGIVRSYLNLDSMLITAVPGSNNEMQVRLLMDFLRNNESKFEKIFVLWGITSHTRWELYSNSINRPSMFHMGSDVPAGKEKEREFYLKNHYNESFQLEKLSNLIRLTHGFLCHKKIEHLFFPNFNNYNKNTLMINDVLSNNFFKIDSQKSSMLDLMFHEIKKNPPLSFLSNPYNIDDNNKIKYLIDANYFSKLSHPNQNGHRYIGEHLVQHLKNLS